MASLASSSKSASRSLKASTVRRCFATEAPIPPKTRLSTAVVLNRSPILTPNPSSFETAYHNYQYKIMRALSTPFPQHFYFAKGAALQQRFYNEEKDRDAKSFGVGFGKGGRLRLPPLPYDKPMPRESEADRTGDVQSLDRKGDRNLYLVLKKVKGDAWRLPQSSVTSEDALHVAARKSIAAQCGEAMDTWVVGRQPIGFLEEEENVFFFKAHILAGQVSLNSSDVSDFAWLTKEEIGDRVDAAYWSGIKDMLADS
ncbi:54S ribosomal protein L17 mitochondrial [Tulasnella sp. 424]|nr:54S ribosomal protein L17 mitochondrial [Tulasnella sp. 424]KAG8981986.1 54S ribosomal protein L17 mitochondrial [Tulasnella sp. 425]